MTFSVKDTGVGIAPDALSRIFSRFEQADGSDTRRHGGVGLGLTVAALLVEALGGKLQVESAQGAGSRFWFSVPLATANAVWLTAPALEPRDAGTGKSAGSILFADDLTDYQSLVAFMLKSTGLDLTLASSGAEALSAVATKPFDLILLDRDMPQMDGYSTARALRELGVTTPIVAVTADTGSDAERAWKVAGCTEMLLKPFSKRDLMKVIERHLSKQ